VKGRTNGERGKGDSYSGGQREQERVRRGQSQVTFLEGLKSERNRLEGEEKRGFGWLGVEKQQTRVGKEGISRRAYLRKGCVGREGEGQLAQVRSCQKAKG